MGLFAAPNIPVPSRLVPFCQPPVASAAALWPLVPPGRFDFPCFALFLAPPLTRIKGRNDAVAADGSFISLQSPIFFPSHLRLHYRPRRYHLFIVSSLASTTNSPSSVDQQQSISSNRRQRILSLPSSLLLLFFIPLPIIDPALPLIAAPTATMSFTDEELDRNWQPNGRRPQSYVSRPPIAASQCDRKAHSRAMATCIQCRARCWPFGCFHSNSLQNHCQKLPNGAGRHLQLRRAKG